jgi:hypothetical protein
MELVVGHRPPALVRLRRRSIITTPKIQTALVSSGDDVQPHPRRDRTEAPPLPCPIGCHAPEEMKAAQK